MKETIPSFRQLLGQLTRSHDAYKVFSAFTTFAACALAHGTREPEYLGEAKRWRKEELDIFAQAFAALIMEMEAHPFADRLGAHYMEFALSKNSQQLRGEFHTPQNICEMMGQMLVGDSTLPAEGPITLCEPASGAGAMILAFAKMLSPENLRRLRVTAIDISKTACDMCFINTTLWGIPAEIIHGDALGPQSEFFARWENIHWIFRGNLHRFLPSSAPLTELDAQQRQPQETLPHAAALIASAAAEQGQPPSLEKIEQIKTALGQQEFAFA